MGGSVLEGHNFGLDALFCQAKFEIRLQCHPKPSCTDARIVEPRAVPSIARCARTNEKAGISRLHLREALLYEER
jgi:hypothetical protein